MVAYGLSNRREAIGIPPRDEFFFVPESKIMERSLIQMCELFLPHRVKTTLEKSTSIIPESSCLHGPFMSFQRLALYGCAQLRGKLVVGIA